MFRFTSGLTVMFIVSLLFVRLDSMFVVFTVTRYVVFSVICSVSVSVVVVFVVRFSINQYLVFLS